MLKALKRTYLYLLVIYGIFIMSNRRLFENSKNFVSTIFQLFDLFVNKNKSAFL